MERLSIGKTNIFFGIFMASYVGLSMMASIALSALPDGLPYWANMLISEAIIILPVALLLIIIKTAPHKMVCLGHIGIVDMILAYVGAYCLMPLIYLVNFLTMFFAKNYVNGMVAELYRYPLWAQLVLLALLPAVVEEFIFRGIFYGSYRRKNVVGAALMSGLLFGITHLNLNQFAYAFAMGAAFCLLYEASGSIVLPMTAHFAINANTVFMIQAVDIMPELAAQDSTAQTVPAGMAVIAAAVFAAFALLGLFFYGLIVKK
ncbi:MAG: CPBP family intramembrane metalloprotease, partial [Alistipes sp.]|nr:CPBP family intramembrane metalloprotease [Alistipes sp.]